MYKKYANICTNMYFYGEKKYAYTCKYMREKYADICQNMGLICNYMQIYVKICTQHMQIYVKICKLCAYICQHMNKKYAIICENMDSICMNHKHA